jgi:methylenetetrahydrofolate dehydrogenase (NADP+)/methenyltetrahydrofolate cyclohydrolase/formyltetrahydrofolate synthetase
MVKELNDDAKISGVLLQLPVPAHLDQEQAINLIGPNKDVDGLHPFNIGSLALKRHTPYFVSCTPLGVLTIIKEELGSFEALAGKKVTLIGRSNIVGMPMLLLLNKYNAFVNLCFSISTEQMIM